MPEMYVERALVPDATRSRLLVVDGDAPALPSWTLDDPEVADSIRAARSAFGVSSPFLRTVRVEGYYGRSGEFATLIEFGAAAADWQPPDGLRWLDFDAVADAAVDVGPFSADVAAWIAELRSGRISPRRSAWARPGWFEATSAWLIEALREIGRTPSGLVEQLGSWPVSSGLALDTDGGRVVLKTVPKLFAHEPELTRSLAARHPGLVPDVLATHPEHGHLLMSAFGGAQLGSEEPQRWAEGLVEMAAIQQAWIDQHEAATRLGVEDRTLAVLDRELDGLITDEGISPGFEPAQRDRLVANLPLYHELIQRLEAGPIPETLVHGDLHPWNVQRDGGRLIIFDWSDACWSHPFFDVATFTVRTEDEAARKAMRSAYVNAWSDFAGVATLRKTLRWAELFMEFHVAITWRRLTDIFEPGVFPFVDGGVQRHLEMALAATDALPQPDVSGS